MQGFSALFAQANPDGNLDRFGKIAANQAEEMGTIALIIMVAKFAIPILIILFGIFCLFSWFMKGKIVKVCRPDERAILERRGKFKSLKINGLVWMWAFLDRTIIVSLPLQELDVKKEQLRTISEEGLFVYFDYSVFFQPIGAQNALDNISTVGYKDDDAFKKNVLAFHYKVKDLKEFIKKLAQDHLRSVVSKKKSAQIYSEKDSIAKDLMVHLTEALLPYGVHIDKTPITLVTLPDSIVEASNKLQVAEREGDAAIMTATKQAAVAKTTAQGQATAAKIAGRGAGRRIKETALGVMHALREMTGNDNVTMELGGAVATVIEQERLRVTNNIGDKANHTFFMPTEGSKDTMGTMSAILAAEDAAPKDTKHNITAAEMAEILERAHAKAREENKHDMVEKIEQAKKALADAAHVATDVVSEAVIKATKGIPLVGNRIRKGVLKAKDAIETKV